MHNFRNLTTHSLLLCAATFSLCSTSFAETYPEPEISTMMFRVDKLPLDPDRMKNIADNLVVLASKNADGDQAQLSNNAKLLAIAMRLDSKNKEAKRLSESLSNNAVIEEFSPERRHKAVESTLGLIGLLSKADEGSEVNRFTNYLKDAMKEIAGDHKLLVDHQIKKQRWKNVLPVIAEKPKVQPEPLDIPEDNPVAGMPAEILPDAVTPDATPEVGVEVEAKPELKWNFLTSTISTPVVLYKKVNKNQPAKNIKTKTARTPSRDSQLDRHWLNALQALSGCPRCNVELKSPAPIRPKAIKAV